MHITSATARFKFKYLFGGHYITASLSILRGGAHRCTQLLKTGGKQLKVEAGQTIYVEKLDAKEGDKVTFDKVVFVGGDKTVIGTPFVEGATVEATVEKQGRAKKVVTFKYKPKKHQHTKQGHRQPYTKVVIDAINA